MFCVLAAPLEGALDAGRALATLAKERSQGFIDAEPYNTRTWNGVWVIPHLHVDGRGGPQNLAPSANARTSAADSDDSFNAGAAPGPSGKWRSGPK